MSPFGTFQSGSRLRGRDYGVAAITDGLYGSVPSRSAQEGGACFVGHEELQAKSLILQIFHGTTHSHISRKESISRRDNDFQGTNALAFLPETSQHRIMADGEVLGMGEHVTLTAVDGQKLDAYVARPEGKPLAGLVVVQEIFGVNAHIRSVADGFANDGFLAVAPAMFDRIEPGVELGYESADAHRAMSFVPRIDINKSVLDVGAAMGYAADQTHKKVGVVGYCFGGTLAWLAATRLRPAAAVGYYGGRIGNYVSEIPSAPVMLHFGKDDAHIPGHEIEKVHAAHPEVEIFLYENAGHAFNRDIGPSYNPKAAFEARERTLAFLKKHLS